MIIILDIRYKNTLYSILLIIGLSLLSTFIFNETDFGGIGLFLVTELIGIIVGGLLILAKVFRVYISKEDFFYNYFGTLNLIMGLFMLSGSIGSEKVVLPILMILNLVIGGCIYFNIFRKDRKGE